MSIDKRIEMLKSLEDGWLDGAGVAIHPEVIKAIRPIAEKLVEAGFEEPAIFPLEDGSVELAWYDGDLHNTIEINYVVNYELFQFDRISDATYLLNTREEPEIFTNIKRYLGDLNDG